MRNLNKPNRYNVASIQAQQTLGGDVMQWDEEGKYVEWRDYAWLLAEKQRLDAEVKRLTAAGNAMDNAISDLDPQRLERSRYGRMTDAEYVAVIKWRTTKDPTYNKA